MGAHRVAVALGERRGERAGQLARQPWSSGAVGGDELVAQRHLGVGQQDRQLGLGEALPRAAPVGQLLVVGQPLQVAVERAACLQRVDDGDRARRGMRRVVMLERQREGLRAVRLDDALADGVAHHGQERVPVGGGERPVVDWRRAGGS